MATRSLAIPISARTNIVSWLENFRNSGVGLLKQTTLDFFDKGNEYNTNAKVDAFNDKVEIIAKALRANGENVEVSLKGGRYSITLAMLNRLKLENFTPELKALVFDSDGVGLKYDSPDAVKIMDDIHKKGKNWSAIHTELNHINNFKEFAKHGNLTALQWLIDKYGVEHYLRSETQFDESFNILVAGTSEKTAVDFFISSGLIPTALDFVNLDAFLFFTMSTLMRTFFNLSEDSIKKILPFVKFYNNTKIGKDVLNFFELLSVKHQNPELFKLVILDADIISGLVEAIKSKHDDPRVFSGHADFINCLITAYPSMLELFLASNEWECYDNVLELFPEVHDLFIFK